MPTAVVIIDVQNAILKGTVVSDRLDILETKLDEAAARLGTIQKSARSHDIPLIIVQHDEPVGSGDPLTIGTKGWEIHPAVAPLDTDIVVHKQSCDSFHATELDQLLRSRGIDHLIIGGCMTQYCVDTTVRRATSMGYQVTLVSDGHMTSDMGALTYDQIIAYHNQILDGFGAGKFRVKAIPSSDISFAS